MTSQLIHMVRKRCCNLVYLFKFPIFVLKTNNMEDTTQVDQNILNASFPPNTCLSDVEDISDIEEEEAVHKLHQTIKPIPRYSEISIFNIPLENVKMGVAVSNIDSEIDAYSKRVATEKQNWVDFVSTVRSGTASKQDPKSADAAVTYKPSVEQQKYLNEAPDLQNFIRDSKAFMNQFNDFLPQFEKVQELQQDLQNICQSYSNRMARLSAAEQLAKHSETT